MENPNPLEPPPNPFYERNYVCSLSHGQASLAISAPGNMIAPQDASDVIEWLGIIIKQLHRYAKSNGHPWVAEKVVTPAAEVEQAFGLAPGTLKGEQPNG